VRNVGVLHILRRLIRYQDFSAFAPTHFSAFAPTHAAWTYRMIELYLYRRDMKIMSNFKTTAEKREELNPT
jgi:hypothetical protein